MGDDELQRWRSCRDGRKSHGEREGMRQMLLEAYLPLVRIVVSRMAQVFPSATAERDDLYQVGVIGLMGAFERFDPDYGVEFRSYASHRIRGQVLDELRKLDWIPRSIRTKGAYVPPLHSLEELQDRKAEGRGSELLDSAPRQDPEQENEIEKSETLALLQQGMSLLPGREAHILWLYYFEEKNLKEIAAHFSLSEARISQIRSLAIGRVRALINQGRPRNTQDAIA